MTPDPYAPYLRQADDLFAKGEVVKAGQIWQAVLKQQPTHVEARERLMAVKQHLLALREAEDAAAAAAVAPPPPSQATPEPPPSSEPVPEPEPAPEREAAPEPAPAASMVPPPVPVDPTEAQDPERMVAEGCTLYDMGQLEDALRKWEGALALDPAHSLARGYANGARKELGLAPLLEAARSESNPASTAAAPDEDVDKLLREAVQLYDMGLVEDAISKWERVLALEPHRAEIEGYLRQARTEVLASASSPAPMTTTQATAGAPGSADPEGLDLKLRQAEHLLTLQRHEEAAFTFQQALGLAPGNARALQGLERCRKPASPVGLEARPPSRPVVALDDQGRIAMADDDTLVIAEPPAALLQAAPLPRQGLSLPDRLGGLTERLPFLKEPKFLAIVGGALVVIVGGLGLLHSYRKDQALKEEVRAARAIAVAPVAQQAQAPDLAEAPTALREEAEATLVVDPLRAYLRAETFVARNPGEASGAALLEKARAGLAGGVTGASLPEFQKHLQNGDLEAALKVMDALLRAQPEDSALRARAGRLHLALCSAHANQAKWEEAQEDLHRGRALFPSDKSWQARLKLLEHIRTLPKSQQPAWIALLG